MKRYKETYIGQTMEHLKKRFAEHKSLIKNKTE